MIHFVLVSILFKTIEETSIFGAICDYKNNMESNNFYEILFLIFIIYLLIDQIKNLSILISKCFSSILALFDTSKMEKDLKGSMIEILKEIFMIIILNIALVNNINIFILLVILILNNPTTKLKNIFEVET